MSLSVSVSNLGKSYHIGESTSSLDAAYGYRTLREELTTIARKPIDWVRGGARQSSAPFWALKNVSFEVNTGEVLGIIGRNGAGKSTLLKLLSRITKPTTGSARMRGRVGSLLEVGTGFHPELTGRENIYLNGAILGMRRHEIARKFDEIVDFAEVEQFLDTPVKRYSSGMYVRLAFAVAAFLEPETLIIDEVLAVGDIAFQRKCLGRMREVGRSGCTILFVSHNLPAVESLCTRAMLLEHGQVAEIGDVRSLINAYQKQVGSGHVGDTDSIADRGGPSRAHRVFRSLKLLDESDVPTNAFRMGGRFTALLELKSTKPIDSPTITIGIDDTYGHRLLTICTPLSRPVLTSIDGWMQIRCSVDRLPLAPGEYWIKLGLRDPGGEIDELEQVMRFEVIDCDAFGEGRGYRSGICVAPSSWEVL
jgi:lipopolysaccharide transport system ATP-binding protein